MSATFRLDVSTPRVNSSASLQGIPEVTILYSLPNDDKQQTMSVRSDLTVDYLKARIYKLHNIDPKYQELYMNDNEMPDPMSLSDFKLIKQAIAASKPINIQVKSTQSDSAKNVADDIPKVEGEDDDEEYGDDDFDEDDDEKP